MGKNNAKLIDPSVWLSAGIDKKTGLPLRLINGDSKQLKGGIKRFLRIIDEQDAVNRYKWIVPEELALTGQEIERFLYYKGQMCFFKLDDKYYLMPYALDGSIDFYGRYNTIHPVPLTAGVDDKKEMTEDNYKSQASLLSLLKLKVIYAKSQFKDLKPEACAIVLWDYSRQYNVQNIIPRKDINDPLIDVMSHMIPYLKTNAILSTGVKGVRVADADQYKQVDWGSADVERHALEGSPWVPLLGSIEMQELMDKSGGKMQEYMQSLQELDNLRLSSYGLANGGMFEKKAHMLGEEQEVNNSNVGLVLEDGLKIREHFCELVKHVFGIEISVEANKSEESMNLSTGTNVNYTSEHKKDGGNMND